MCHLQCPTIQCSQAQRLQWLKLLAAAGNRNDEDAHALMLWCFAVGFSCWFILCIIFPFTEGMAYTCLWLGWPMVEVQGIKSSQPILAGWGLWGKASCLDAWIVEMYGVFHAFYAWPYIGLHMLHCPSYFKLTSWSSQKQPQRKALRYTTFTGWCWRLFVGQTVCDNMWQIQMLWSEKWLWNARERQEWRTCIGMWYLNVFNVFHGSETAAFWSALAGRLHGLLGLCADWKLPTWS